MGVCSIRIPGIDNSREKSRLAGASKKQLPGVGTSGIGKSQPLGDRSRRRTVFFDQRVFTELLGKYDDAMRGSHAVWIVCRDTICMASDAQR